MHDGALDFPVSEVGSDEAVKAPWSTRARRRLLIVPCPANAGMNRWDCRVGAWVETRTVTRWRRTCEDAKVSDP